MKIGTTLSLASLLLVASTATGAEKKKQQVRTKEEVSVKAAKAEQTKLAPKEEKGPAKPTLRAEEFLQVQEAKVAQLRDRQIAVLDRLIQASGRNDPELPDLFFRKAELLGEKSRYYEFQARGLDQKTYDAKGSEKKRLEKEQKAYEKASKKWIYEAVKTYLNVANSDNPVFRKYERMDSVLFSLAFLLTQAKKQEQARVFFLRLIKDYPTSRFIPDAYLAFAEYYFYAGDMKAALKFYEKVAQYPESKVYGFALYKTGWCWINLSYFERALNMFVQVIKLSEEGKGASKLGLAALQREAKRDAVRAYSEIGAPEKAWPFFQKIGGTYAPKMLELLADAYYAKGRFKSSIRVYRELMSLDPKSASLCEWQNEVVRATLASKSKADQVKEVQRLAAVYEAFKDKPPERKEALVECRQSTRGILRELATIWHKEAQKTQNNETYDLAQYLYKEYLLRFPDEKDTYLMRFYYAELLFKLGEVYGKTEYWERAAEQYTTIVKANPKGEHLKEAAYAAVIAWKNALNVDEQAYETQKDADPSKPIPIPEKLQKMLAAFDTYVKYVPDAPELVQIKYNRARIYYEHNRFADAAPLFDDIASKHSKHELAVYAANLYLDSLNVLERYGELDQAVDRYLKIPELIADPSMHEQLIKLKQGSQWKYAEQLSKQGKHKEAALLYVEIANAYPTWERYPQVLYNAAIQFEAAYLIGQAIRMREFLIKWEEEKQAEAEAKRQRRKPEPLAQKAIYEIGANYHALAWYSRAADYYERYATEFPGEKNAPTALYSATLFRMGLGEEKKAIENSRLFAKNYGTRRKTKAQAAAVFYEMHKIFETQGRKARLIKHLDQYLKSWSAHGGVDRKIVAMVKIGEIKWALSCDKLDETGACIEVKRVKARAVRKKKKRKGIDVNLKQCGPDTKMRITVFNRRRGQARKAQDHFSKALALYGNGKALKKVGGDTEEEKKLRTQEMMYAVAAARFYQAEQELEKFLQIEFPRDLSFNKKDKKKFADSQKRFSKWLETKGGKLTGTQEIYQRVITLKVAHWAIAAAARIGQLFQTFADQLYTAPIPKPPSIPWQLRYYPDLKADFLQAYRDGYCDALVDKAEPLETKAIEGLKTCLGKSTELSWFNNWSRLCEAELNQIRPTDYPIASEIRLEPGQVASNLVNPSIVTEVN